MRLNRILLCINPNINFSSHSSTKEFNRTTKLLSAGLHCSQEPITIINNRHCIKCKYFDLYTNNCGKFKQQSMIMGDINDVSAEICRKDETKCGQSAVYYNEIGKEEEEKRYKEIRYGEILKFSQLIIVSCTIQTVILFIIFK